MEVGGPLLFLHGFPGSPDHWEPLLRALAVTKDVHCPRMPWLSNGTPAKRSQINPTEIVSQIVKFCFSLSEKPHLVGHDLGAGLVWIIASYFPDAIKTAVAISAPHPNAYQEYLDELETDGYRAYLESLLSGPLDANLEMSPQANAEINEAAKNKVHLALSETDPVHIRTYYRTSLAREQIEKLPRLPQIVVPTLQIRGSQDSYFPDNLMQRSAEFGTSPEYVIGDAKHFLPLTHPLQLSQKLKEFWNQNG